ncbi:hypothetical protein AX16_007973 [Volvariella volvacea WC 439]|nr:hypothetical protein AX16_007973 [Volvariella volvacea WC 439]
MSSQEEDSQATGQAEPPTVESPRNGDRDTAHQTTNRQPLVALVCGIVHQILPQRAARTLVRAIESFSNLINANNITRRLGTRASSRTPSTLVVNSWTLYAMGIPIYRTINCVWLSVYTTALPVFTTSRICALPSAFTLDASLTDDFETTGAERSIDDAIALETLAISQCKEDRLNLSWWQHSLAVSYRLRFGWKAQVTDLDAASQWVNSSMANTLKSNTKTLIDRRSTKAAVLRDQFKAHATLADLDAVIAEARFVVNRTHNRIDRARHFMLLGSCLHDRYIHKRNREDLDESIDIYRKAIGMILKDHASRYTLLNRHGDLKEALGNSKQAAKEIAPDNKNRYYIYEQLGTTLLVQYKRDGVPQDLELSLKWVNDALEAADLRDRYYFRILMNMAQVHQTLFKRQGNSEDFDLAFMWVNNALTTSPLQNRDLAYLHHFLGFLHREQWSQFRHVEDLDPAINAQLLAVQMTPPLDPELHDRQANLGLSYSDRYRKFGDQDDQEQALKWLHFAVDSAPPGHGSLSKNLPIISYEYSARYSRRRKEEDLEKVIMFALRAVELLPKDEKQPHWQLFGALGIAYSKKADLNHDSESIENAHL